MWNRVSLRIAMLVCKERKVMDRNPNVLMIYNWTHIFYELNWNETIHVHVHACPHKHILRVLAVWHLKSELRLMKYLMFKKCSVSRAIPSALLSQILFIRFCLILPKFKVSRKNMHIKPAISGKDKTKNNNAKIKPWVILFENTWDIHL